MNEASSKFVDNIAVEKLINEKLSKVSHSIKNSVFWDEDNSFDDISALKIKTSQISYKKDSSYQYYIIPSFYNSEYYIKNNNIYLYQHLARAPIANILFIHGLYDDNLGNYDFLIRLLKKAGFNVYFMILPYHYQRKPAESLFSGEYFLSADLYRARNAYIQAIYDIEASLQFINYLNTLPVMLTGFSMGGSVTLRYYSLRNQVFALFLINPVTNLLKLVWNNSLFAPIGKDIIKSGFDTSITDLIFKDLDPCLNLSAFLEENFMALAYSKYDQIIEEEKYKLFIKKTGIKNVYSYYAGHLNLLRVPKLSKDISSFFRTVR